MADNKPTWPTTTTTTWADNANIASGPQSGSTTKLEPSDGYKQAGAVPGRSIPGRYMNWLFNKIVAWCYYVGDLHNQTQFLNKSYAWITGTHSFATATTFASDVTIGGDTVCGDISVNNAKNYLYTGGGKTYEVAIPLAGQALLNHDSGATTWGPGTTDGTIACTGTASAIAIPIKQVLRQGCTITRVRMAYDSAGTGAKIELKKRVVDPASATSPAESTIDSDTAAGAGVEILDTGTFAEAVDDLTEYYVVVTSSATLGDIARWLVVSITASGLQAG